MVYANGTIDVGRIRVIPDTRHVSAGADVDDIREARDAPTRGVWVVVWLRLTPNAAG